MTSKTEQTRLEELCRSLWNEYDPIGVRVNLGTDNSPDWFPDDEYESYVPHTVTLVLEGADAVKHRRHIEHCCTVNMGLRPRHVSDEALTLFVERLLALQKL